MAVYTPDNYHQSMPRSLIDDELTILGILGIGVIHLMSNYFYEDYFHCFSGLFYMGAFIGTYHIIEGGGVSVWSVFIDPTKVWAWMIIIEGLLRRIGMYCS